MKLSFSTYNLELRHTFAIANYSRTSTPVVLVEVEHKGLVGYGEASLPQYLGETQESVCRFLQKVDLSVFSDLRSLDEVLEYVDSVEEKNTAAKAAIDIALHDLWGKLHQKPVYKLLNIDISNQLYTSFTIGIDSEDVVRKKIEEAQPYAILKIKVNKDWRETIRVIRKYTDKPLFIDANQSWTDKHEALESVLELKDQNVLLIEQPLPKDNLLDSEWLTARSPLPIIADESVQRLCDINKIEGAFHGINVKLMKCTGIAEAYKMILSARTKGMKVMLGCMTETSCAISAAAQLSPLVDFADLDGNLLIKNDCFDGVKIIGGKITLNTNPGIGVRKKS